MLRKELKYKTLSIWKIYKTYLCTSLNLENLQNILMHVAKFGEFTKHIYARR